MKLLHIALTTLAFAVINSSLTAAPGNSEKDWPQWRGLTGDNKAAANQSIPVSFSPKQNVIWSTSLPGRGHASPTVAGNNIFLATSDEKDQTQSVIAINRTDGALKWTHEVNKGNFPRKIHRKNTHASSTIASDGTHAYATFYNNNAIHVVAVKDGKTVWSKHLGPFVPRKYEFGYGASPTLHNGNLIVVADYEQGGFLVALNSQTGEVSWRTPRPKLPNYSPPIVATVAGREQLLISGCNLVASYNPVTGTPLWDVTAIAPQTCGTMVWEGDLVFASGGYPKKQTAAIRADGSGTIVWSNTKKCYEQSMLTHEGYLYGITDSGVTYCWRTKDGKEMWSHRLNGPFSASPVLVGSRIYVANERGTVYVFNANPKQFESLAENQLGDDAFATLTICDNRIYARVGHGSGEQRQEKLYCIGE